MGVLTLNIECHEKAIKKTMQFEPRTLVHDACRMVRDKLGPMHGNPNDYGLFRVEDDPTKCVWMENGRTLEYYLIRNGDTLEYKNKIRSLRVRTLDGGAVKTIFVDESQPVSQLMVVICSKMGIANHDEYSLVRGFSPALDGNDENGYGRDQHQQIQRNDRERTPYSNGTDQYDGGTRSYQKGKGGIENTFMNTIGRKKERQIQQLRAKLHTEEEIHWVDHSKTLREQNIGDNEELTLRRKFFFSDTNVDTRDPLYIQCRDGVLRGLHPVSRDTAIKLAALQCYIEYGPFEEGIQRNVDAKNLLPKEYSRAKELEKNIIQEYRELIYEDSAAPKKKYCELCQSLPTYGVSFFLVKEKMPGKNKLIPRLLGVNKESVMRVDERTKAVLKEWPLEQVRRWAASYKTFTLDFGDYKDGYYSVQTLEGERIGQLIGGYIDIILKKKRIVDHTGIEGDEGATMDIVAPARATLLAHSEPTPIIAQEPGGTMYGIYRPETGTPPQAPQYGGVSGMILAQRMPKGEDIRYLDSRERSQRALVGTIEATIRAVEEAEEEIAKPPQIDLPRFGETQRHWRVEVEKESVGDRLAAMGAATAEVVQLTAIPEESAVDTRVGNAIATIGSNLPEMGRGVRELAALMPDEHRAGDLVDAARKLCNAFGTFLDKVHPEHQEKRANILSAASRVGELSNDVLSTIQERTEEELSFHDELNRKARAVATSTAQLVLQAKTVSADCDDPGLKDQVIQSAMKTAYATSELVACTRVVGPTIEHPPCKEHLTDAAHCVARAVHELLEDASKASQQAPPEKAENFEHLRESASRVTNALDDIIGHVQGGPWGYHRKTQQDYTFEQIVESSNRILAHPGGAPPELFRYSETAIRNSQMLVDGMEQEANKLDSVQQREKLLNAARSVAQATSSMIDATKECQNRPGEAEPQLALKSATSQLVQATNHATIDRQIRQTIQQLEKVAKEVASATTQTIAAANSARPHIHNEQFLHVLVQECVNTGRYVPPLVQRIKENQNAKTPVEHFKAHVGLIHECQAFVQPSANLVDLSRSAVPYVYVAELRTAVNNAQQLDFEPYLEHSEEFINSLDHKLQQVAQQIRSGYPVQHSCSSLDIEGTTNSLRKQSRLLNSAVAQMVSAAYASERRRVSIASMELVQSLGDFTESVTDVVAARQEQKRDLISLESLILNARSVVHDSSRIFDRIRERNSQQLEEAARTVTESLRRTLAALPGDVHVEQAIEKLRNLTTTSISSPSSPTSTNLRASANQLVEDADRLLHCVHSSETESQKGVERFSNSFGQFYSIIADLAQRQNERRNQSSLDGLINIRDEAIDLLDRFRFLQADKSNISLSQALSTSCRQFSLNVWTLVELVETHGSGSAWVRECDQALQKIKAIRHLFGPEEKSSAPYTLSIPLNGNSYYESLAEVTNEARNLGDGMNGLAHYARRDDTEQLCLAVRKVADAVCGLAKNAAQSAYLIGVGDTSSEPGRAAIYDVNKYQYSIESLQQAIGRLNNSISSGDKQQLLDNVSTFTMHSSDLASICRDASEKSANISVRSKLVNSAVELTSITAALITAVKNIDKNSNKEFDECLLQINKLRSSVDNLQKFLDNPDFGPIPAKISVAGRQAQQPLIGSSRKMLDASSEMIGTAKALNENPSDASIWQQIANNSSIVSESIKHLVAAIRDEAPGQADLDQAINILSQLIQQVDNAFMAAAHNEQPRVEATTESTHQQILHSLRQMLDIIDPLKIAAISHAEAIGRNVRQQLASAQTLAQACIQAALLSYDSRTQANVFEQCKTVLESSIQLMFATKDSGGNPKAVELHTIVEESAEQQQSALLDLQRLIQQLDSENGLVSGLIDGISRSIAVADKTQQVSPGDSLADIQARMVSLLNIIGQTASDVPLSKPTEMGQLFLQLDEHFRSLSEDSRVAQSLMSSSELGQRLKSCVQNLGMACIELVKLGARRRNFPNDQRIFNQLSQQSSVIEERIREILVVLSEGARGTQACINAAQTVSGIIGDLDTTIMFATSGSLNPPTAQHEVTAVSPPVVDHRDVILRTAKALFEDTKALVSGAASNQEQLAVAAQNSVRSILQLTEAVKSGASKLSPDSTEAQVMMIHAVRDVASALSNLIQATTHASGRSPNDPAIGNLKEAAKVMVSNVSSLLKAIKTIEDSSQRGAQALEAAINAIDLAVKQYNNNEMPIRHAANGEDVIRASRATTVAAEKAAGSASLLHQENVIAAANLARQSVGDLLGTVRTASLNATNPDLKYKMLNSGREVALQLKNLLVNILQLYSRPDHPATKQAVLTAAKEISKLVGQLSYCGEQLHSSSPNPEEKPLLLAENELLGAASSIEAASNKLSQMRPRQVHKADEDLKNLPFDEQILSAAKSITTAVQILVKAAYNAQRELISQGRMSEPSAVLTKDEQYWTEGLVSAATLVAAATSKLYTKRIPIRENPFCRDELTLRNRVAKMARLGPKDRVGPRIFGPKKTRLTRLDKNEARKRLV
ncbi:unnamed protein product [Meloidogyne enterolobii]|uniref:Uncharacterized protein n=1 Tax=Meloidogyne enterolobii TaxID=390850 RepID=A0ACB0ZTX5_MELEN